MKDHRSMSNPSHFNASPKRFLAPTVISINATASVIGVLIGSLIGSSLVAAVEPSPHRDARRPNFIVFIADDLSWDDCGAYGHPSIRTPHIDRLASEGMTFDYAVLTISSCSPSRSSIMTSRYPHATGAGELHQPLPANQVMMTKPLSESGYWTAAVGKWHLGEAVVDQVDYRRQIGPEKMGEAWVEMLRKRPKDKPFFLWAAALDPHRPYPPGAIEKPHSAEDAVVPPFLPDHQAVRDDLADYYDEIGRFDRHIGITLDELVAQGVADNTVIFVLSDNGRPFPHCKTRIDYPGVGMPLIIRFASQIQAGSRCNSLVSSIDLAPTILDLAGVQRPESFQGVSLKPLFANPTTSVRDFAFAEHNWHDYRAFERSVFDDRYGYVRNWLPHLPRTPPADAVRSPTFAVMKELHHQGLLDPLQKGCMEPSGTAEFLYAVRTDPNCLHNLASDPSHREDLERLRNALKQWQDNTDDQFRGEESLRPDAFDRLTGERK